MKYIKTFEKIENIDLSIDVSLFPNHKGLKEGDIPTTGTWTSFVGASHHDKIISKCFDIIWMKYFNHKDPCKDGFTKYCRPEYESYPQDLADTLEFFKNEDNVVEFEKSDEKKYWKYEEKGYAPVDRDEIKLIINFKRTEDALDWLDLFDVVLNNINKKDFNNIVNKEIERIELKNNAKKYNL